MLKDFRKVKACIVVPKQLNLFLELTHNSSSLCRLLFELRKWFVWAWELPNVLQFSKHLRKAVTG